MSEYLKNFGSREDIIREYEAPEDALDNAVIHLAWYGYGSYEGSSLVIFEKEGKLYEVNGGHCSCRGLEGQWYPEETSWEALDKRDFCNIYYEGWEEAESILKALIKKNIDPTVQ